MLIYLNLIKPNWERTFYGVGENNHFLFRFLDVAAEMEVDRISLLRMKCEDNFPSCSEIPRGTVLHY